MPNPTPPTAVEAATLLEEAWEEGPDWFSFLWSKFVSGARRGERCAKRANQLNDKVLSIATSIYKDSDGQLKEKDTKAHQQRRIVLDDDTDAIVRA